MANQSTYIAQLGGAWINQLRSFFSLPTFKLGRLTGTISNLVLVPRSMRVGEPSFAEEYYSGKFVLGGTVVRASADELFKIKGQPDSWYQALHGFQWLRHMNASDNPLHHQFAKKLVSNWINTCSRPSSQPVWTPAAASERLISWLCYSSILVDEEDSQHYRNFMVCIHQHINYLNAQQNKVGRGYGLLETQIALAYAALCVESPKRVIDSTANRMGTTLDRQIFPDGGHVGRNPALLVELLAHLLPLREAYQHIGHPGPPGLTPAIDRMMPALRFFKHRDGTIARFNGSSATSPGLVTAIILSDDAFGTPIDEATHSGYQRISAGASTLISDVGNFPPGELSNQAHAGHLSFELSSVNNSIIINCGAPNFPHSQYAAVARTTAAHSTAILHDTSTCTFNNSRGSKLLGSRILRGPDHVSSLRKKGKNFTQIIGRHDGYMRKYGVIHERILQLSKDGKLLFGRDMFTEKSGKPPFRLLKNDCVIRFHVHPDIDVKMMNDQQISLLVNSDHQWLFTCDGGQLSLDASIFLASNLGPRPCKQVLVQVNIATLNKITWKFEQKLGSQVSLPSEQ